MKKVIVKLPNGYAFKVDKAQKFYYNGNLVEHLEGYGSFVSSWVTTKEEPKELYKLYTKQVFKNFSDGVNNLTREEFYSKRRELEVKAVNYGDDDEGLRFALQEDYDNYRDFKTNYKAVYEDVEVREDLEFEVVYAPDSSNPYIKPCRVLGEKDLESALYFYKPNLPTLVADVAKEFGFTQVEDTSFGNKTAGFHYSYPNHSADTMEYLKINDKYVYGSRMGLSPNTFTGTYEQCEERYKKDLDSLRGKFRVQYNALNGKKFTKDEVSLFYNEIKILKGLMVQVDPKSKTYTAYRSAINKVDQIIKTLESI